MFSAILAIMNSRIRRLHMINAVVAGSVALGGRIIGDSKFQFPGAKRIVMAIGKSPASGHGTVSMRSQKRMLEDWALETLKN